jgi:hypothetical protein
MREVGVYPIVRECHLNVDDDDVREACDRLVQLIKRSEEGEEDDEAQAMEKAKAEAVGKTQQEQADDDEKVVELF